ncbi:MAG: DUF5615 family PIN-like protein [Saprospiraceae bacterium]|nr:DUF5615 family PIN-like protein [Saprospiraceae bacterium]
MRFLIDMNLSPDWVDFFQKENLEAMHWSHVGDPRAPDTKIFNYAKVNDYIIFTHDLDFGAILAATNADAPSVIQAKTQDITPNVLGPKLIEAIRQHQSSLEKGALLTLDELRQRIRLLPLK